MESKAGLFLWLIYMYFFQPSICWGETLCSIIFEPYLTHFFPMFFLALWVVWWNSPCVNWPHHHPIQNSNSKRCRFGSQKIRAEKPRPRNCRTPWILRKKAFCLTRRLGSTKNVGIHVLCSKFLTLIWRCSIETPLFLLMELIFSWWNMMTWWRWDDNMLGCWHSCFQLWGIWNDETKINFRQLCEVHVFHVFVFPFFPWCRKWKAICFLQLRNNPKDGTTQDAHIFVSLKNVQEVVVVQCFVGFLLVHFQQVRHSKAVGLWQSLCLAAFVCWTSLLDLRRFLRWKGPPFWMWIWKHTIFVLGWF